MGKRGFFGWLVGLVTGTALGVLFAPRKGKETRERIKKVRKEGGMGYEPILEDMKKLGSEISGVASEAYEGSTLQEQIEEWRRRLNELSEELVSDVSDFHRHTVKPAEREVKAKVREGKRMFRGGKKILRHVVSEVEHLVQKKKRKGKR